MKDTQQCLLQSRILGQCAGNSHNDAFCRVPVPVVVRRGSGEGGAGGAGLGEGGEGGEGDPETTGYDGGPARRPHSPTPPLPRWTTIVSRRFRVSSSSFSSFSKPSTTCTTFAHSLVVLLLVLGLGKKRRGLSFQHTGPRFVTAGGNVACLSS